MSAAVNENREYIQGSHEWLALRKTKITATDSSAILGLNPWKTRLQLYHEKLSDDPPKLPNFAMQRGLDLEPIARDLFCMKTGKHMKPEVIVKDWAMASLDGIDYYKTCIVEIKCPGEKDHATAVSGKIPEHYYPQLQHQMYVCDLQSAYYFSFDGIDGVIVNVDRDDEFIEKMVVEEHKFYLCLQNKTPPEPTENDYIKKDDPIWQQCASRWKHLSEYMKELEREQEELKKQMVFLSGGSNAKGSGISLYQVQRKGSIDYSKVPQLKGVDLEKYRKQSTTSWRIS